MPARAERVDVDPVDLSRERKPVAEIEAALQLGSRALGSERDLETARHEPDLRTRPRRGRSPRDRYAACTGAPPPAARSDRDVRPNSRASSRQRWTSANRGVEVLGRHAFRVELARNRRVEAVERGVQHLAAEDRVGLGIDPLRDRRRARRATPTSSRRTARARSPRRRACRSERSECGAASQLRRSVERRLGAVEAPRPVVRSGERCGTFARPGRQTDERTETLPFARRGLERPGQRGQRAPLRRALHVGLVEERADVVPEGARLPRHALVAGGLADEEEPTRRPRAGRIEEVAVARDRSRGAGAGRRALAGDRRPRAATGVPGAETHLPRGRARRRPRRICVRARS